MYRINVNELTERSQVPIGFSCINYPINYSIQQLVDKFNKGQLILPDFQRKYVWSRKTIQEFLRSSALGSVPVINLIFVVDPRDPSKTPHILDGLQRLSTLAFFVNGYLTLGEGDQFNKAKFSDLPEDIQQSILNKEVQITKIETERKNWAYLFRTYNKGGSPLNAIEIRRSVYDFPLMFELNQIAEHNQQFITVYGKNNRFKGQHVLLRALAMHDNYKEYQKPLESFLDLFCDKLQDLHGALASKSISEKYTKDILNKFNLIIKALYQHDNLNKSSFRLTASKPVNTGLIDCMIHAGLMLLETNPDLTVEELSSKLAQVHANITTDNYAMTISLTTDTSGRDNVLSRMSLTEEFVKVLN
jgi:hypothetical protein